MAGIAALPFFRAHQSSSRTTSGTSPRRIGRLSAPRLLFPHRPHTCRPQRKTAGSRALFPLMRLAGARQSGNEEGGEFPVASQISAEANPNSIPTTVTATPPIAMTKSCPVLTLRSESNLPNASVMEACTSDSSRRGAFSTLAMCS